MRAEKSKPETIAEALDLIGALFRIEKDIKAHNFTGDAKRAYRQTHAKPAVDAFFAWCEQQCQRMNLEPSYPLTKALKYVHKREQALRVYLDNPDVPMSTSSRRGCGSSTSPTTRCVPTSRLMNVSGPRRQLRREMAAYL